MDLNDKADQKYYLLEQSRQELIKMKGRPFQQIL